MPTVRGMLRQLKTVYRARHYGYSNADILVLPHLFSALSTAEREAALGRIKPSVSPPTGEDDGVPLVLLRTFPSIGPRPPPPPPLPPPPNNPSAHPPTLSST